MSCEIQLTFLMCFWLLLFLNNFLWLNFHSTIHVIKWVSMVRCCSTLRVFFVFHGNAYTLHCTPMYIWICHSVVSWVSVPNIAQHVKSAEWKALKNHLVNFTAHKMNKISIYVEFLVTSSRAENFLWKFIFLACWWCQWMRKKLLAS